MDKKWIVFYISSHGFGHMTRCLAIIEELLEKTDYSIYIASGKFQNDFAGVYLEGHADRLLFRNIVTDIGLINNKNSLKVDTEKLQKELFNFTAGWDTVSDEEFYILSSFNISCIISDISPIGALVAEKLGVRCIGISNFTWVEQYESLELDCDIIQKYIEAYKKLDCFIEYELALPMESLKIPRLKTGFISRKIDPARVEEIKQKHGNSIIITCGKSANLENINVRNFDGCIFTTSGINITGNNNVVKLPLNTPDTQNYIAAGSAVITKAGWGTISEAVIAKSKLVLIEREDVFEDTYSITELKNRALAISIKESALTNLDMVHLGQELNRNISLEKLNTYSDQTDYIIKALELG
ncbi:MAG: hypothetical protein GX660_27760 [Clostridiaceae bacterium]|nr:hypothetical protein [Clostridiaceae bacterium]